MTGMPSARGPELAAAGSGHVPVRPAATVVVVRDRDISTSAESAAPAGPLEVLMLRRSLRAIFMPGVHVFPGGAVDESDRGVDAARLCTGRDDMEASHLLGVATGGLAWWVAAVRECFEEAGILLAQDARGEPPRLRDPDDVARFARHRAALASGVVSLVEVVEAEGLRLPAGALHYFAHWITPEGERRRYDTRFFVALAPRGQVTAHDEAETISHAWVRPAEALARHQAGEIELVLPTIRTLETLARFPQSAALMAWARDVGEVRTARPWVVATEDGTEAFLPPDPDDPAGSAVGAAPGGGRHVGAGGQAGG
ncbi:MAG: NUDIX hydrolase [Acidimicrobiales bacterium]